MNLNAIAKPTAKREASLFTRVQKENKQWLTAKAKEAGYTDAASYLDAILTGHRQESPIATETVEASPEVVAAVVTTTKKVAKAPKQAKPKATKTTKKTATKKSKKK